MAETKNVMLKQSHITKSAVVKTVCSIVIDFHLSFLMRGNRPQPLYLQNHPQRGTCRQEAHRLQSSEIVQAAGDALVAVGVKSIEVDGCTAIYTAVYFAAVKDRLAVSIYNAGSRCTVGIDKVAVCVSRIIRTLQIAVTKRSFQYRKCRHTLAAALQLGFALGVSRLDCCLDLVYGCGITLRNDEDIFLI